MNGEEYSELNYRRVGYCERFLGQWVIDAKMMYRLFFSAHSATNSNDTVRFLCSHAVHFMGGSSYDLVNSCGGDIAADYILKSQSTFFCL